MIWTSTTAVATQSLTSVEPDPEGPQLGSLIAEHGLIRGLRRRIEDWREYPPHGPISLSTAQSDQLDLEHEALTRG
jgi:hypothetical protein